MEKLYNLISKKIIDKYQISNLSIKGITCDSRNVKKGFIFAAFQGSNKNGINYIKEAIDKGAIAILIDKKSLNKVECYIKVTIIPVSISRKVYAIICNKFYNNKFDNIINFTF